MSTRVRQALQGAAGAAGGAGPNVEDVFSTYLYTGNASTQAINNGIDLSGEGGLLWIKKRSGTASNFLFGSDRSADNTALLSNTNLAYYGTSYSVSHSSTGFTVPATTSGDVNENGHDYASWTFRKAPKFFDVVTYTGDGTSSRQISHNLGTTVGMTVVKCTSNSQYWHVLHRSGNAAKTLYLNRTDAEVNDIYAWNSTHATSTHFTIGAGLNTSGRTYVAYLFAHNNGDGGFGPTGDQDIIKCGSYTGTGSNGNFVNLGFEPQWIMVKRTNSTGNWIIVDNMRSLSHSHYAWLYPNTSDAEGAGASSTGLPSAEATGFTLNGSSIWMNASGSTYIYIAIRRGPMAVPESATDVFAMDTYGGTSPNPPAFNSSGFPVDMAFHRDRSTSSWQNQARLIQGKNLSFDSTGAEVTSSAAKFDYQDGFLNDTYTNSNWQGWMFRRAPNFFDVVAFTAGTSANRRLDHNLGVAPEMVWVKRRDGARNWYVYHEGMDANPRNYKMHLNLTSAKSQTNDIWGTSDPTATDFGLNENDVVGTNNSKCIAYLFASLDGISKVGSYTGTGTSNTDVLNIDCGFSNGARFVLIKRTDSTGNWWVFDTLRGITTASSDPVLNLDTSTGGYTESTMFGRNVIQPYSSGFGVSSFSFNYSGYEYIYYAIA